MDCKIHVCKLKHQMYDKQETLERMHIDKETEKLSCMKYSELIKKTIIVTITSVITLIVLWFLIALYIRNSIRIIPEEEQYLKQEFRQ